MYEVRLLAVKYFYDYQRRQSSSICFYIESSKVGDQYGHWLLHIHVCLCTCMFSLCTSMYVCLPCAILFVYFIQTFTLTFILHKVSDILTLDYTICYYAAILKLTIPLPDTLHDSLKI